MKFKLLIKDYLSVAIIFIISCLFVLDLFINKGQPATFDGPTHLANIAMFYKSMSKGEWHVTWTDGFANYGMPLGLIAQQVTSYLGAIINFFVHNVVLSYNIVVFIGVLFSTLFFYLFLRKYAKPELALLGSVLFHFAPYRIINVYIRGALPEFFASVFLPLILIGMHDVFGKHPVRGLLLISVSFALLILTHPMMVVIYGFIIGPYFLYLIYQHRKNMGAVLLTIISFFLGFGLTGYYSLPLQREIRYFYYGSNGNHFTENQYMTLTNFIDPRWFYFLKGDIFTRGHFIQSGLFEFIIICMGIAVSIVLISKMKKSDHRLLYISSFIAIILMFFMSTYAIPIFRKVDFISNIQHQWRLFSAFIFVPPLLLVLLMKKISNEQILYGLIILICIMRFPELYGKNYTLHSDSSYYFTKENLHGNVMNTVWTGPTQDYLLKKEKPEIIQGEGNIVKKYINESVRRYTIDAKSNIRMADNTFYFPGWQVFVDNKPAIIQYQDPAYRGVITYDVQSGIHEVVLKFTATKIRIIGMAVSIVSLFLLFGIMILFKKRLLRYEK